MLKIKAWQLSLQGRKNYCYKGKFDKSDNLINRNYKKKKKNNWLQSIDFLDVSYKIV